MNEHLASQIAKQEKRLHFAAGYAGYLMRSGGGFKRETIYSNRGYRCLDPITDGQIFIDDVFEYERRVKEINDNRFKNGNSTS